jgi:protein TonB
MMSAPQSRWTTERIVGVGFVGLLHVVAVYAIMTGLAQKIVKAVQPDLIVTMEPVKEQQQEKIVPPKLPDLPSTPQDQAVTPPDIVIANDTPAQISLPPTQPTAPSTPDAVASSISSTHTTPPYPGMARKLGEQGTVKLRLTISAQGVVTAADVVQSSGFADLDQTAVGWVTSHWKYKPAVQGGVAVASTTMAAVVFNLRTAG